jgi:hypothetical protein
MNALPLRLFVHVEEPSAKEALDALLPKLIGPHQLDARVIEHGGKASLLANLPNRLRGYAAMPAANIRVMVLVDRDRDECHTLKARLEDVARAAGMSTKTNPTASGRFRVVNRIGIEELEAWFIGDVEALRTAFPRLPVSLGQKAPFRDPDAVPGGTWEALHRVLQQAGYYVASERLPKIELARLVAKEMQPERNRSASFRTFVRGIDALVSEHGADLTG